MLDHHQGHGGSGDAPGAGGPWLAGVDTAGVPGSPTAPLGFASQVRARSCSLPRSATSAPPRRPTSWVPSARLRTRAAAERARAAASLPPIRSPYTVSAPPPQPQAGSAADHDGAYMHQQHRCSTSISSSSTTSTTSSNKAKAAATAAAPAPPPGPRQSRRYRGRKREAQALAPVRVLRRGRRARPIREEQEEGLRRLLLGRAGYAWPHREEEKKKAKFEFAYQTVELVYDDKKQGYVLPAGIGRLDPKMQIRPDGHVRRRLRV